MKRFIYFFILAAAIVATGCSKKSNTPSAKSAVTVKGHTYGMSDNDGYVNFYFASNFTCTMTSNVNGEYTNNPHMTYKIDGNNVDIYRDKTTYWQESARGTLLFHMVYYPDEDKLVWDGAIFKRVN